MDSNKIIKVCNRSGGTVVYAVPEMGIRRQFQPREVKNIKFGELESLSYQQGGKALLYHFLMIEDEDALRELINGEAEPEYWLTENQIPGWLNTCSLAQFVDALNFAPEGVKDLIKKYSVSVPLNDVTKRQKVLEILEFNVDAAVKNEKADKEGETKEAPVRISAPTPGKANRQSQPTYKIVKSDKE